MLQLEETLATLATNQENLYKGYVGVFWGLNKRAYALQAQMQGQIIYYVGPSPAKPGRPVGAAGPTTSYRMDAYAPELMRLGLKGMIGKGARNQDVKDAMATFKAVYFARSAAPVPLWPRP